jgi:Doubled CXXCH motif (Paired_CXXCH_1)
MAWMPCLVFPKARLVTLALLLFTALAQAQIAATNKISDVRGTKHNLSSVNSTYSYPLKDAAGKFTGAMGTGTVPDRTIKASTETQVCVFCHTPHEATTGIVAPLWNRKLSGATYTPYSSSSLEADAAELAAAPGGSSKLCLSCHDGTMAIDKVNVLNGIKNATITMTGTSAGKMPTANATAGFTRNLGTDLSNDHPISFTYDSTLAGRDGELRSPDGTLVGNRVRGATPPKMPLENSQMQCATCHDPHLRDKTASNGNAKFLRMNRFQATQPTGGAFSAASDTICLACHDKAGTSWAFSAHANSQVATQTYKPAAAQLREFPSSLDVPANANPPVWQVGCLNCHDTHSVQGSRRLLREGVNTKTGGSAALEETCYQCHAPIADSAVVYTAGNVKSIPDIKTDFGLARRMPISAGTEVHDIGGVFSDSLDATCSKIAGNCGKDLLESRTKLGVGNLNNRHAECSDCHNPHRVVKFRDFRGNPLGNITGPPDAAGTHPHTDTAMNHTNIASGVLRGSWGVEPTYGAASFSTLPASYQVKRGDPKSSVSSEVSEKFVTREYQICLKCHSDYGYSDNNLPQTDGGTGFGNRPTLSAPGTPTNTNGATMYTNQAKEFQAPSGHAGTGSNTCINAGTAAGAAATYNNCNHRSWHPVMNPTGRTTGTRGMSSGNPWLAPWNNQVGANTMYCSDCHGSGVTSTTSVIPNNGDNGSPWGPHGSANDFILKGSWTNTGGGDADLLCFKCHTKAVYSGSGNSGQKTGFYDGGNTKRGNLHNYHVNKMGELRCTWCHVAVPHGWKNKGLLVNLNDLGPEVGKTAGTRAPAGAYTNGPYYYKAVLRITSFANSGAWTRNDCGGGQTDSDATKYMKETMCASPP